LDGPAPALKCGRDYGDGAGACQGFGRANPGGLASEPPSPLGLPRLLRRNERVPPMHSTLELIHYLIWLYQLVLIGAAIFSWFFAFRVFNPYNHAVRSIADLFWHLTEPVLRPIRRILPHLGGIDISPVIALLLLWFINNLIYEYLG